MLRATAAAKRRHDARECRYLDEVAPFHCPRWSSSVVTGLAVDRDLFLGVAIEAKAHVHIYFAFRRGLLSQIAVAGGAIHFRANMRRVIKAHMCGLAVVVDPHPGNLFSPSLVGGNLLDLGPVGRDD